MKKFLSALLIVILLFNGNASAQGTGFINRPATSASGKSTLDPNDDGYTSATTSGFAGDDVTNSEIAFKPIPAFSHEPFGDLRRGPNHLYSDFVPDANGRGVYCYFDNTHLLFRFRVGSVMSGSKGYSILIDTDGKFGATGDYADPNFQAATTGVNGNPGYEIEIVFETNFRIAIYQVDGTSTPTLVKAYTNWQDQSQISIAGTNDHGDPDFFIDFFVPFSDLQAAPFNLTTATPLRMSATTVMAPQAAIGGPKSDLYGVEDAADEEAYIKSQCSFSIASLQTPAICPMCTAPPVVNGPISTGTVTISGSWTKSTLPGAYGKALIRVYKNGILIATDDDSTASGGSWSIAGLLVANNDVITASAHGYGETICLYSNRVIAQSCNTSNIPSASGLTISCASNRGLDGSFVSGNEVKLYFINPATLAGSLLAGPSANSPTFGYNGTTWYYNGTSYNGSNVTNACSGGSPDMSNGVYYVTTVAPGSTCESAPVFACLGLSATTSTPTITQTALYPTSTVVSGTATTGAQVNLFVNGQLVASTSAAGGAYNFSGLQFNTGDRVEVRAITTNSCMSAAASLVVSGYTKPPVITADANNEIAAGQPLTGTSPEPAGTVISVFATTNTMTPVATTTVRSDGSWSTADPSTTPGSYPAVSGTTYYATAQNGTCARSAASANATARSQTAAGKCGTITGPIDPATSAISGTLNGNSSFVTVNLYLDGNKIGSTTTSSNVWGPIAVNTADLNTRLYSNGILTIGIAESGMQETSCPASATTISCSPTPLAPAISSSTNTTTGRNQTVSYTISNAVSGHFYALADASTGASLGVGQWATSNGSLVLTTQPLSEVKTYNVLVKATGITGTTVCTSTPANATIVVSSMLPVRLLSFKAKKTGAGVLLEWVSENETAFSRYEVERSMDGAVFQWINSTPAVGSLARVAYSTLDKQVFNGTRYYRLKMVDQDGRFTYSQVIVINDAGDALAINMVEPNPFNDWFSVNISVPRAQMISIELLTPSGQVVYNRQFRTTAGLNRLTLSGLDKLSPGLYVFRVTSEEAVVQQKLLHTK